MSVSTLRREWASNIRGDILAGMTVALALIPEAIPFVDLFAYGDDPPEVRIDLGRSHIWDQSAVAAIAKVRQRYRQQGRSVYVIGLNPESQRTLDAGFS